MFYTRVFLIVSEHIVPVCLICYTLSLSLPLPPFYFFIQTFFLGWDEEKKENLDLNKLTPAVSWGYHMLDVSALTLCLC